MHLWIGIRVSTATGVGKKAVIFIEHVFTTLNTCSLSSVCILNVAVDSKPFHENCFPFQDQVDLSPFTFTGPQSPGEQHLQHYKKEIQSNVKQLRPDLGSMTFRHNPPLLCLKPSTWLRFTSTKHMYCSISGTRTDQSDPKEGQYNQREVLSSIIQPRSAPTSWRWENNGSKPGSGWTVVVWARWISGMSWAPLGSQSQNIRGPEFPGLRSQIHPTTSEVTTTTHKPLLYHSPLYRHCRSGPNLSFKVLALILNNRLWQDILTFVFSSFHLTSCGFHHWMEMSVVTFAIEGIWGMIQGWKWKLAPCKRPLTPGWWFFTRTQEDWTIWCRRSSCGDTCASFTSWWGPQAVVESWHLVTEAVELWMFCYFVSTNYLNHLSGSKTISQC